MGTHEHPRISSLHTYLWYLCSARFIVNITHQHDNGRILQAVYSWSVLSKCTLRSSWTKPKLWLCESLSYQLCMLFSATSGNYVRAAWNRAKSRIPLANRRLVNSDLHCQFHLHVIAEDLLLTRKRFLLTYRTTGTWNHWCIFTWFLQGPALKRYGCV